MITLRIDIVIINHSLFFFLSFARQASQEVKKAVDKVAAREDIQHLLDVLQGSSAFDQVWIQETILYDVD